MPWDGDWALEQARRKDNQFLLGPLSSTSLYSSIHVNRIMPAHLKHLQLQTLLRAVFGTTTAKQHFV
jgi:hypothetical protein